jgi:hypothetical protein
MESQVNLGQQPKPAGEMSVDTANRQVGMPNGVKIASPAVDGMMVGGSDEMESEALLKRVAGESKVEIVNLLKTEISDRYDSRLTYRLRVRADMEKLISFLQVLERWGLDRVVIDRVSAKRRGDVWETNLEVTSYFGTNSHSTSEVASK